MGFPVCVFVGEPFERKRVVIQHLSLVAAVFCKQSFGKARKVIACRQIEAKNKILSKQLKQTGKERCSLP